jgi:hypothetical protein
VGREGFDVTAGYKEKDVKMLPIGGRGSKVLQTVLRNLWMAIKGYMMDKKICVEDSVYISYFEY